MDGTSDPVPVTQSSKKQKTLQVSNPANETLSVEGKKQLCALIQSKPLLWSLLDPLYRDRNATNVAWSEISSELGVSGKVD